jgi:predicted amidophosphoribosyltransferase
MPFCPKCWKEYPKGFATCEACQVPLTNVPPQHEHKHEHEHEHEEKPKEAPKKK